MNTGNQSKLSLAAICIVVCGSGLLVLLLGLREARHDRVTTAEDTGEGGVQAESGCGKTPGGQSAAAPPATSNAARGDARPKPETEVNAPAATDAGMPDVEELAKREVSKSATGAVARLEIQKVERNQDQVMSGWPPYASVRGELLAELSRRYALADLSAEELVDHAVTLREQFWQEGGNLSASAWKSGYEARLLAELAAEKAPRNLTVVDEWVETLQSVTPMCRRKATGQGIIINREVWDAVHGLREKQFAQIKAEMAAGRKATFQDFVCGVDLLYFVQDRAPHHQRAIEVLQDLQAMCRASGWSKFLTMLQGADATIKTQGYGCTFRIYQPRRYRFPEEYSYHRRFPSFRGPKERDVGLLEQLP